MEYIVNNEQDMQNLVVKVLSKLRGRAAKSSTVTGAVVLALSGELGAGKTTFTKVLARELGIVEVVTSPTFVIQKSYKNLERSNLYKFDKLVHIDAYRLESGADAETLELSKTLAEPSTLVVIEWAENIKEVLPKHTIHLSFKHINETTRKITIDGILTSDDKIEQD